MRTPYYREQMLERIARDIITAYDPKLRPMIRNSTTAAPA